MTKEEKRIIGKAGLKPAMYRILLSSDTFLYVEGVSGEKIVLNKETGRIEKAIVPRALGGAVQGREI